MKHDLKILPEYFVEVLRGNKTFEVRKNDRSYNVGDEIVLHEYNCGKYTERTMSVIITYILRNPNYCKDGYCIIGFKQYGEWKEIEEQGGWGDTFYRCSVCNEEWLLNDGKPKDNNMNFCPQCGSRMGGDKNEQSSYSDSWHSLPDSSR